MARTKQKAKAEVVIKKTSSGAIRRGQPNNYVLPGLDQLLGGTSVPLSTVNPQPATIGDYTYNNPVPIPVLNQPATLAPVTLSNPGADLPADHPIYETLQPAVDPGFIPPAGTVTTTDVVKPFDPWPTDALLWIIPLLAIVAFGIYYYSKKK